MNIVRFSVYKQSRMHLADKKVSVDSDAGILVRAGCLESCLISMIRQVIGKSLKSKNHVLFLSTTSGSSLFGIYD